MRGALDPLSAAQRRALAEVESLASGPPLDRTLRTTVHFHPDRLFASEPLLAVMARDGVYRGQFETRTSNGGLTAHPGDAARSGLHDEQDLKKVWHYLARFGAQGAG